MVTACSRKIRQSLILLGSMLALTLGLILGPASAQASIDSMSGPASVQSTSEYCGGWQGPYTGCNGAARSQYQVYGWGDQGTVCVGIVSVTGLSCSSGAGSGVYSAAYFENVYSTPYIENRSGGNNFVHGISLAY